MKITHCKLRKSKQKKFFEFLWAEETASATADLLEIQPNTLTLFYYKIRLVISHHLSRQADDIFVG